MEFRSLENESLDAIIDCFLEAFTGYFVSMPQDPEYYKDRWKTENIDFSLSFGAFEGTQLVGFILHSVRRDTAHNSATGVLPDFRGRGLVRSIYEFAVPALKERGVENLQLEVIVDNKRAIKAYEGFGFQIDRKLWCFKGTLMVEQDLDLICTPIDKEQFSEIQCKHPSPESWHNKLEALSEENQDFFQLSLNGQLIGAFVLAKRTPHVHQVVLVDESEEYIQQVFSVIAQNREEVAINNIDDSRTTLVDFILNHSGLENPVDQFEMRRKI